MKYTPDNLPEKMRHALTKFFGADLFDSYDDQEAGRHLAAEALQEAADQAVAEWREKLRQAVMPVLDNEGHYIGPDSTSPRGVRSYYDLLEILGIDPVTMEPLTP